LWGGCDHLLGEDVLAGSRGRGDDLPVGDAPGCEDHPVHVLAAEETFEGLVERDTAPPILVRDGGDFGAWILFGL
jgi:hypothetical protein